jgi:hypothetical protein
LIGHETFKGLDRNRIVEACTITSNLARMVANPSCHARQGICSKKERIGFVVPFLGSQEEKTFHVVPDRAARRTRSDLLSLQRPLEGGNISGGRADMGAGLASDTFLKMKMGIRCNEFHNRVRSI